MSSLEELNLNQSLYRNDIEQSKLITPDSIDSGESINDITMVDGFIKSGKTGFNNTEAGFILGLDNGVPKLYIGNDTNYINWTGTTLTIVGGVDISSKLDKTGGAYSTTTTGARLLIFPNANTGIQIIDDGGNDVFKVLVGGTDVGDVIIGDYSGGQGIKYDKSAGTIDFQGVTVTIGSDVYDSSSNLPTLDQIVNYGYYTAGENIDADKVVCIKAGDEDIIITKDTYVVANNPDTNYNTDTVLIVGHDGYNQTKTYIAIPTSSGTVPLTRRIMKAELMLYVVDSSTVDVGDSILIQDVTTTWDETTMTWNTGQPTETDRLETYLTSNIYTFTANDLGGGSWITIDLTQIWKRWKESELTSYGISLYENSGFGAGELIQFASSANASTANRPYVKITYYNNDGTIYTANCDDYAYCREIIGITKNAITSGESGIVLKDGCKSDINTGSDSGFREYLTSTGTVSSAGSTRTSDRYILIGTQESADNTLNINIQKSDYLVEEIPNVSVGSTVPIYAQEDAMKAIIDLEYDLDSNYFYAGSVEIKKGETRVFNNNNNAGDYLTITWNLGNAETITLAVTGGGSVSYNNVKFYN